MSSIRIHTYIFREVAAPAAIGLLVFTFVLFMGRILKLAEMVISKGISVVEIGRLFASLLPAFLVITLPLAFLLGVLLGFSRLSADSEIVALKASGVSLYGFLAPALLFGILISLATAFLTLYAEPAGNAAFRRQLFQIATTQVNVGITPQVFNDEFDGLVIYASSVDQLGSRMEGVMISDQRVGDTPSVILAESGRIIADRDRLTLTLRLQNGTIHRSPREAQENPYQVIGFRLYDINLNLGRETAAEQSRPRKAKELATSELLSQAAQAEDPEQRNRLLAELHQRLTLPFAPLLFALVGVPLGIQSQRSGRSGGFAIGLLVFLAYYLLFSFSDTLATKGGVPPVFALWLPNAAFLAGGLLLLVRTARERHFTLPTFVAIRLSRLRRRGASS